MEAISSFERWIKFYQAAPRHISENNIVFNYKKPEIRPRRYENADINNEGDDMIKHTSPGKHVRECVCVCVCVCVCGLFVCLCVCVWCVCVCVYVLRDILKRVICL
jgi:hypothetical protein